MPRVLHSYTSSWLGTILNLNEIQGTRWNTPSCSVYLVVICYGRVVNAYFLSSFWVLGTTAVVHATSVPRHLAFMRRPARAARVRSRMLQY
eukprot:SAG11_NODE_1414_length_4978_cov_31.434720_2_plen_91_part_00